MHKKYQPEGKKTIENYAPGIYYIHREMYRTQVIVTSELSPDENLYLRCLTNQLTKEDVPLVEDLVTDYRKNQEQTEYLKYMDYLAKRTRKDIPLWYVKEY